MDIHSFTVGPFAENSYLLIKGSEALLIDPGFTSANEFSQVQSIVETNELSLLAVLLTHAHVDHALGVPRVLNYKQLPVYLSDKDRYLWNNFVSQASMFGLNVEGFDFEPEILPIQQDWSIGEFTFDVLYTPGHSPDHVSLYSQDEGILIAGDALFREGIGRTDLYKGSMETLKKSIKTELYTLPDDTTVYCGHGPKTTIGHEKQANPFVSV
ncbi:MBL fold metallo-hydrolase [Fodinibius salsisoli]|uniref:MBL fold metallo-hydrolase n=1 Tax=Fodinibius salsisoli TaxID=2820877 RepID=A0ABT3PTD8_9BACT|nr:MBL fold metallo-hydrolase [Fodinibius salsisoli]MCW9709106.1 MBL fold metallo-hydrolase [Fodinibius salsisoli]